VNRGSPDSQDPCALVDIIHSIVTFYLRGRIVIIVETPPFVVHWW